MTFRITFPTKIFSFLLLIAVQNKQEISTMKEVMLYINVWRLCGAFMLVGGVVLIRTH
jgi:hypothetical protein